MISYAAEAADYHREAAKYYRRARADAQRAGTYYAFAADRRGHAAWLTQCPDLWDLSPDGGTTPSAYEDAARSYDQLGDLFLRASFSYTDLARSSAGHAHAYNRRAAEQRARAEAYEAELRAITVQPGDQVRLTCGDLHTVTEGDPGDLSGRFPCSHGTRSAVALEGQA